MKTTREMLLNLFDKPGWGARTLRGLRDGGSSREFDDIQFGKEAGHSRKQRHEVLNQSISPQRGNDIERLIPNTRPRLRHGGMIRDRIRLFDGGMNFPSPGYNGPWKLKRADDVGPSQSPPRHQQITSPTKPRHYSVFPPKSHTGALTQVKSYGYLRPKEITPLPWRPLDARRWETVAHLTNTSKTSDERDRPRERVRHSLITPTPTNAALALKKVQVTHQNPNRNISEKVSVLCATGPNERDKEHFQNEIQEEGLNSAVAPYTQVIFDPKTARRQDIGHESLVEAETSSETNESKPAERLKPAKESKIQDRINLFNNKGPSWNSFALPITRMRNQSTPTKLPSQAIHGAPAEASRRLLQRNRNTTPRVEERSTEVTATTAADIIASSVLLETAANQPRPKPQAQELASQAPAPRNSSGISDKIQHFETCANRQATSIGRVVVDTNKKWPSLQSKRFQTWPVPARGYVFNHKTEQHTVPGELTGGRQTRHEFENIINPEISNSTESKDNKVIKTYQDRERAKQKIHYHQERLNCRPRSRSRSAPSVSGLVNEWSEISRVFEHMEHTFEVNARIEKRRSAAEGTKQQLKTSLDLDLETTTHQQRPGDGRVQKVWIDGSEDGPLQEVVVVDTIVAQCELAEPRPMRLAETLSMIRLCRGRFKERSGTWRRKVARSSEKGARLAA